MPTFTKGEIERLTRTFTANEAFDVTVPATDVTSNSQIIITLKTPIGPTLLLVPIIKSVTPGSGFEIASAVGDFSIYNFVVL